MPATPDTAAMVRTLVAAIANDRTRDLLVQLLLDSLISSTSPAIRAAKRPQVDQNDATQGIVGDGEVIPDAPSQEPIQLSQLELERQPLTSVQLAGLAVACSGLRISMFNPIHMQVLLLIGCISLFSLGSGFVEFWVFFDAQAGVRRNRVQTPHLVTRVRRSAVRVGAVRG